MKELVIIVGTVILGCIMFNLIAGNDNSLKAATSDAMEKNIKVYEESYP